jgi:hypothetical protein
MRRAAFLLPFALGTGHSPLRAQNPECAPDAGVAQAGRVCNAAVDGAGAFHPIVGLVTSGGNPVLGRAGSLGGPARFAITARVNGTADLDLSTSRTMAFANAGLDFQNVRIVGEAGYQFGKDQDIGTVFQDFDPAAGRFFAAAGLQFGV